jgi:SAM-dependent methyltransferase
MNAPGLEAQWDEDCTKVFLTYAEGFIPYREVQYRIICQLLSNRRPRRVVELCCGQGKLGRVLLGEIPEISLHGYDGSELMLQTAKKELAGFGDRFSASLFDIHATDWRRFTEPVDAFVSSLALHHLKAEEKRGFYRDLHRALAPGGLFVNADLVWPLTPEGRKVAAEAWNTWVSQFSRDAQDDGATVRAFEGLRWNVFQYPEDNSTDYPLPVAQELELLSQAGFAHGDVYWMCAGHAVLGAAKATVTKNSKAD